MAHLYAVWFRNDGPDLLCHPTKDGYRVCTDEECLKLLRIFGVRVRSLPPRCPAHRTVPLGAPISITDDYTKILAVLRTCYFQISVEPSSSRAVPSTGLGRQPSPVNISSSSSSSSSSVIILSKSEFVTSHHVDMSASASRHSSQPEEGNEATSSHGGESGSSQSRKWKPFLEVNNITLDQIDELYDRYHIDRSEFKISLPRQNATFQELRSDSTKVAIYPSFFEAGLRLPIDPFLSQVFDNTSSLPIDTVYNTIVNLVTFAATCRARNIEPTIFLLTNFYMSQTPGMSSPKLTIRARGQKYGHICNELSKKITKWDDKLVMVESKRGWNFALPSENPRRLLSPEESFTAGNHIHVAALREFLGLDEEAKPPTQQVYVSWKGVISDEALLVRCGLSPAVIEGIESRVPRVRDFSHIDWNPHGEDADDGEEIYYFADECPHCSEGRICSFRYRMRPGSLGRINIEAAQNKAAKNSSARREAMKGKETLPLPTVEKHSLKEGKEPATKAPAVPRPRAPATKRSAEGSSQAPVGKKGKNAAPEPEVATVTVASPPPVPSWLAEGFTYPRGNEAGMKKLMKELEPTHYISKMDLDARGRDAVPGCALVARVADKSQSEKVANESETEIVGRLGIQMCEMGANFTALAEKSRKATKRVAQLTSELEQAKKFAVDSVAGLKSTVEKLKQKLDETKQELGGVIEKRDQLQGTVNSLEESVKNFDKQRSDDETMFKAREESIRADAVEQYIQSEDFTARLTEEALPLYNQGRNHILRMASAHGIAQDILATWATTNSFGDLARSQAAVLPFQADEIENIKEMDAAAGVVAEWVPPPPQPHPLDTVIDLMRRGGEAKLIDNVWECTEPAESPLEPMDTDEPATPQVEPTVEASAF